MPDPKVEIVGIRELRLGEVLTMSYPGFPVLGTKQVVPMFLEALRFDSDGRRRWPSCEDDFTGSDHPSGAPLGVLTAAASSIHEYGPWAEFR